MRKSFNTRFDYGDPVVLNSDPDVIRIVTGYLVRKGSLMIGLTLRDDESFHLDADIKTVQKPFKVKGFKG